MSWALGFDIKNGKLVTKIAKENGEINHNELDFLINEGIPPLTVLKRKFNIVTDFQTWTTIAPDAYAAVFGLDVKLLNNFQHQFFSFKVRETDFQVPALVLIRAFFNFQKFAPHVIFGPQVLDAIGYWDEQSQNFEIHDDNRRWTNLSDTKIFSWMHAFPSANTMAHSIHEHALRRIIGISLPDATVRLAVAGEKIANTYFVTKLSISKILTSEHTYPHITNLPSLILEKERDKIAKDNTIPLRDGEVNLLDEEWNAISPILLSYLTRKPRISQRYLFDAILYKLHTGEPWQKINCAAGNYFNACHAYRTWKVEQRTFEKALSKLKQLRDVEHLS